MKLFNSVRNYIGENKFRIIIYEDKIDIVNYKNINDISNDVLKIDNILIKGKNLKVNKLLNNEVLITGLIGNISFE